MNISLNEFQRMSKGDYNAGEVRLASESKLTKMNNHVHTNFYTNDETISHAEVIAIKQSFIKALSQNGVKDNDLNSIRKELGLAAKDAQDKSLSLRSIVPLKRQKIREILDRHAATINAYNAENDGDVNILTTQQLFNNPKGRGGKYLKGREAVNASLDSPNRRIDTNEAIARFQMIVTNSADYVTDEDERQKMLSEAKSQLNALMHTCDGRPREDHLATASFSLDGGQEIAIPTGMNEKAFAERLEDIIVRFAKRGGPIEDDVALVRQFQQKSAQEKTQFLSALDADPQCGAKMRTLLVHTLFERGVDDYATLSMANRLSDQDVRIVLSCVLGIPSYDTPDQIRNNYVIASYANKAPVAVPKENHAYVPATSNTEYNRYVQDSLKQSWSFNGPITLLPQHQNLVDSTKATVRARLGADAMSADAGPGAVTGNETAAGLRPENPEARRLTADALRETYLAASLRVGAENLVINAFSPLLREEGVDAQIYSLAVFNCVKERNPELIDRLAAAENIDRAKAILEEFNDRIKSSAKLWCKLNRLENGSHVLDQARKSIAEGLGVARGDISDARIGILKKLNERCTKLSAKIISGEIKLESDEEIEAEFKKLADGVAKELLQKISEADSLDLPQKAKDYIKASLIGSKRIDVVNLSFLATEAKKIKVETLESLLKENAPMDQIFTAMKPVSQQITALMNKALEGVKPDEEKRDAVIEVISNLVVRSHPGLDKLLDAFIKRPDARAEIDAKRHDFESDVHYIQEFAFCVSDTRLFPPALEQAKLVDTVCVAPREVAAFKDAGGEERAFAAGYHKSELPMLAKAFVFYKAVANCDSAKALEEALNANSKARRLASYGGKFTESVENFRKGMALFNKFNLWFLDLVNDVKDGKTDSLTKINIAADVAKPENAKAIEKFVFEEIAYNIDMNLDEEDAEKLFGVAHNKAMRFIAGNHVGRASALTLATVPPEKRWVIYDVFATLEGAPATTLEEKANRTSLADEAMLVSRILKKWELLETFSLSGDLTRENIIETLYGDCDVANDATTLQLNISTAKKLNQYPVELLDPIQLQVDATGETYDKCAAAVNENRRLPNAQYVSPVIVELADYNGKTDGGLADFKRDVCRPANAKTAADEAPILDEEDVHFTFNFPDGKMVSKSGREEAPEVAERSNAIAARIETFCGKVHQKQLASVYKLLSQSGVGGNVKNGFRSQGIFTNEHFAMDFTFTKDDETGAVTIAYKEPEGFPLQFHWTATVALDGTVKSTPMVINQPQPQQPVNPQP